MTIVALIVAVSAQDPLLPPVPLADVPDQDVATTSTPEPGYHGNGTIIDYFSGEAPELYPERDVPVVETEPGSPTCDLVCQIQREIPSSPEPWGLLEPPRFTFAAPAPRESKVDVTSEEFLDVASQNYVVKRTIAFPIPEESSTVVLKLQANQTAIPGSPLAFQPGNEIGALTKEIVGFETKWLDPSKDRLEIALAYHYDLARARGVGGSLKYTFPELFAPVHIYAKPEVQVNADGSNQEKLSLAVWSDIFADIRRSPAPRLTATVGIRRQDIGGRSSHESYALDWGTLLKLSERFSVGVNMSYSWDDYGLGTRVFLELKAPARTPRVSPGGYYEPGNP